MVSLADNFSPRSLELEGSDEAKGESGILIAELDRELSKIRKDMEILQNQSDLARLFFYFYLFLRFDQVMIY